MLLHFRPVPARNAPLQLFDRLCLTGCVQINLMLRARSRRSSACCHLYAPRRSFSRVKSRQSARSPRVRV